MRQALHIFKKDVRHLWLEIVLVLAVTAVFACLGVRGAFWMDDPNANRGVAWTMAQILLPFSWWILTARAVYGETLPGDRQFWITRPYRWPSLLGAKLLFIAVFVNLPWLAADVIILRAYGFVPAEEVAGLVCTQLLFSIAFLLPVAALCALTTGFVQLLSGSFVLFVVVLVWNTVIPKLALDATWGALDWITVCYSILVAGLAGAVILLWQYARRNTWAARSFAAVAALAAMVGAALIPWTSAFAIQSRLAKQPVDSASMRVVLDSGRKWLARVRIEGDQAALELPLRIDGIPDGVETRPEGLTMSIDAPDGRVAQGLRRPWMQADSDRQILTLETGVDASFYQSVKDKAVKVRGTLYVTLFGNRRTTRIPFNGLRVPTPGMGICSAPRARDGYSYFLFCSSAFRTLPDMVSVHFIGPENARDVSPYQVRRRVSYSPLPADLDIKPVNQYFTSTISKQELSEVVIDAWEPLAYVQRDFELDGLRLGEFEATPMVR
jgi:hypothetical protein